MARKLRQKSKTGIYHVMSRTNHREKLFIEDDDYYKFLDILSFINKDKQFECYAYCLMTNHFHIVINENKYCVSKIMQRLNTSYAQFYNKKYNKRGHLFEGRFVSEPVEDIGYLLTVVRYVHNNPVKANIIKSPEKYKWSSFTSYFKPRSFDKSILNKDKILCYYSQDKEKGLQVFKTETSFMSNDEVFLTEKVKVMLSVFRYLDRFFQLALLKKKILNERKSKIKIHIKNKIKKQYKLSEYLVNKMIKIYLFKGS